MTESRPSIPANLKRRVLLEAGHRCSIPTCRNLDVDIHHIVPWEQCRKHEYKNLIALCPICHRRAERGEIDRKSLRAYKSNLRFTHDKFSNFEVDILFRLYNQPDVWLELPHYLLLLIIRILEIGYVEIKRIGLPKVYEGYHSVSEIIDDYKITITSTGKGYIESLGELVD